MNYIRKLNIKRGPLAGICGKIDEIIEAVNSLRPKQSPDSYLSHTTSGVSRKPKIKATTSESGDAGVWL